MSFAQLRLGFFSSKNFLPIFQAVKTNFFKGFFGSIFNRKNECFSKLKNFWGGLLRAKNNFFECL